MSPGFEKPVWILRYATISMLDSIFNPTRKSRQGFFQPFWEGALGPLALGNFRYFNRNRENFFNHFYTILLNKDPKTALNHSYSWLYALF